MADKVDYIEVGRKAHELSERHGVLAHQYAYKLAREAGSSHDEERLFWEAVAASLKPR